MRQRIIAHQDGELARGQIIDEFLSQGQFQSQKVKLIFRVLLPDFKRGCEAITRFISFPPISKLFNFVRIYMDALTTDNIAQKLYLGPKEMAFSGANLVKPLPMFLQAPAKYDKVI